MKFIKKQGKLYSILLLLLMTMYFVLSTDNNVRATTTYQPPLRSWIRTQAITYTSNMTPDLINFDASHHELFISPETKSLSSLKNLTSAPALIYDNYYCMYVGKEKYNAMVEYASAHGVKLEDMFLHYSVDTQVTFSGETHVLPTNSRVATYGWYNTAGDLTKAGARVAMNVGNPNYRAFNAEWERKSVDTLYNGASYDGVFIDNSQPGILSGKKGTIGFGGSLSEYAGDIATVDKLYDADIAKAFAEVRAVFGPKGVSGSKFQMANNGNLPNRIDLFPYIDESMQEFWIGTNTNWEAFERAITQTKEANVAGVWVGVNPKSQCSDERSTMTILATYYAMATDKASLVVRDSRLDASTCVWNGAMDFDIGQPRGELNSNFAFGVDPSSAKKDTGNGVVTNESGKYVITDTSKNWAANYWGSTSIVDNAGSIFSVSANTANSIPMWRNNAPYPVGGHYEIGNFIFKVYTREFDNALVIYKPSPAYNQPLNNDTTATTHILPSYTVSGAQTSNRYFRLHSDGTIDATPITQVTLQNQEGLILVKADLNGPSITKNVDKTSASSGDILTYKINYGNSTQNTYTNVHIEDNIPVGTAYVAGSASNSGSFDGTKITWAIGNLGAGATGFVTFQVKLN